MTHVCVPLQLFSELDVSLPVCVCVCVSVCVCVCVGYRTDDIDMITHHLSGDIAATDDVIGS